MRLPTCAVVIVTKDRKDELRRCIHSVLAQTVRTKLIIVDDGSTDGTADMARAEFPDAVVGRSEQSVGLVVQRDVWFRQTGCEVALSLDDDAILSSPKVLEQALAAFDHPRVAVVDVPLVNHFDDGRGGRLPGKPAFLTLDPAQRWVLSGFHGGAHVVRTDVFAAVGGYRGELFHQAEEHDFSIRMMAGGHVAIQAHADPIDHYPSPRRDRSRTFIYGARNAMLYCWHHVPLPDVLLHLPGSVLSHLRVGLRVGHVDWTARGLVEGLAAIPTRLRKRRPVSRGVYRLIRRLTAHPMPFTEVEPLLGPMALPAKPAWL